jgi:hypothetical protein
MCLFNKLNWTTANTAPADLSLWGYKMSDVGEVYRNFASGGYWGVADFFRAIGYSDKCREEGGLWNAQVITHFTPGALVSDQKYQDPNGHFRRVSIEISQSRSTH